MQQRHLFFVFFLCFALGILLPASGVNSQVSCNGAEIDSLIMYTAVLLPTNERVQLVKAYPPVHIDVYAEHMTMVYEPCTAQLCDLSTTPWGKTITLSVLGNQSDTQGQAVAVSPSPAVFSQNNVTHVTISCAPGVPAVYSNTLLETDGYVHASQPYKTVFGRVAGYAYNGTWLFSYPGNCSPTN